jgi:DNA (cytosine-5)-methyltransferase 1
MNVLSLFDGMSCGQQALERSNIKVDNYFASEIDKYAMQVTMANYPNTKQLGSVIDVDGYSLPKIDLLIGGSPCQSFSFAGKRKGMSTKDSEEILTLDRYLQLKKEGFEFEGQSYLFWEYMRLMYECKPKYFLLENVMMGEKWEKILSKAIGVNPIMINSSLLSAQNRQRLYWTNIGLAPTGLFGYLQSTIEQPKNKGIVLKDILENQVDKKYFLSDKMMEYFSNRAANFYGIKKCVVVHNTMPRSSKTGKGGTGPLSRADGKTYCLDTGTTNAVEIREVKQINPSLESGGKQPYQQNRVYDTNGISPSLCANLGGDRSYLLNLPKIRRLTPIECERLQTVKDNYTNHVSDSQRYKMIGNGWTVDVICHLFSYIKQKKS